MAHPLWTKLSAFEFDAQQATLTFTRRLARDNGWSAELAKRVVDEYRRFLFLSQVAGHPVTPSDEVDQAWHLHLVYTRSYWDELCGRVLEQPLHHGPTRGGPVEGGKFEDWYERTLGSYREWFGEAPPEDIWPSSRERFGRAPTYRRISLLDCLIIPRRLLSRVAVAILTLLVALGTSGFIADISPLAIVIGVVVLVLLILIPMLIASAGRGGRRSDGSGCGGGGGCGGDDTTGGDSGCGSGCGGCGG